MANTLVTRVNSRGIPCIRNINANLDTTRLTLTFASHPNVSDFFQGLFLVNLTNLPVTTGSTLPVYLQTEGYLGSEKQLFTPQGAEVTAGEVVDGVYLCFYDSTTGKVRVMM